jgi:hypothetical protein
VSADNVIWIRTTPTPDGNAYVVVLEFDTDTARTLTPDEAMAYARTLLRAIAYAEYDAAVYKQMRKLEVDHSGIGGLIADIRRDRPPIDPEPTAPLVFAPGVNLLGKPFVTLHRDGEPIGQWNVRPARRHALGVMQAVAMADMDTLYLRTLTAAVGVDEGLTRQAVSDVGSWRRRSADSVGTAGCERLG